ncbi:MAG: PqqD family peptide modification chaperone [Thermodesulfobacteriota bacterium]
MPSPALANQPRHTVDSLRVKRAAQALSTDLEEETIILEIESGIYSGLEGVASRIWELLAGEISIAELRGQLMAEYEVTEEQCQTDLLAFLDDLAAAGLLEVESGPDQ